MGDEVGTSDWHGTIGRLAAWWLNSGFRRLADVLVMGDGRSIVLHEISTIAGGDEVVLDLGAGSGYFSIPIAEMLESGKVLCLDLSEEMLSSLEHKAKRSGQWGRVEPVRRDAIDTGLQESSVDIVVSSNFMHELADPGKVATEIARVLKPGGRLLVSDFRASSTQGIVTSHHRGAHGPFSVGDMKALLLGAGLIDVTVETKRMMLVARAAMPG
ncbi:MAG TPA: class I SAM-dependent methyltransferase [Candidatus Anoxymicrobiaceae bacterium]